VVFASYVAEYKTLMSQNTPAAKYMHNILLLNCLTMTCSKCYYSHWHRLWYIQCRIQTKICL